MARLIGRGGSCWSQSHRERSLTPARALPAFSRQMPPDIALILCAPADTVPRACRPPAKTESDDGLPASAHAPGTLVPGTDPDAAAVLGRLRLRGRAALRHGSGLWHFSSGAIVSRA